MGPLRQGAGGTQFSCSLFSSLWRARVGKSSIEQVLPGVWLGGGGCVSVSTVAVWSGIVTMQCNAMQVMAIVRMDAQVMDLSTPFAAR